MEDPEKSFALHCHFTADLFPIFKKLPETASKHFQSGGERAGETESFWQTFFFLFYRHHHKILLKPRLEKTNSFPYKVKGIERNFSFLLKHQQCVSTDSLPPQHHYRPSSGAPTLTPTTKIKRTLTMTGQLSKSDFATIRVEIKRWIKVVKRERSCHRVEIQCDQVGRAFGPGHTVCRAGVCRGVMGTAWSDQPARGLKTTRNPQYAPCLCPPKHLHTKGTEHHRYQVPYYWHWVPQLQILKYHTSQLFTNVKMLNVLKFDVEASEYWFGGLRPPGFRLGQLCLQPRGMLYIIPRE